MNSCEELAEPGFRSAGTCSGSSKIKTLIVHRNPSGAEELRHAFSSSADYEVVADCLSGVEAAEAIFRHEPEILLLDVRIPKMEVLRGLLRDRHCPLVFYLVGAESSVFNQFTRAERELVLPDFKSPDPVEMARRVRRHLSRGGRKRSRRLLSFFLGDPNSGQNGRFAFKCGQKMIVLNVDEIVSIESANGHSHLNTLNESYPLRYSLVELASGLDPQIFYRLSSSALVNVNSVRQLNCGWGTEKFAILEDGRSLRVTQSHAKELKKIIDATWGFRKNPAADEG